MPKIFKKFALIFLSSMLFLNSMAMPFAVAHAQAEAPSPWYNQGFFDWYGKVYDKENSSEIFGERYTAAQVQWIIYGLISFPINLLGRNSEAIASCSALSDLVSCGTNIAKIITEIFDVLQISGIADQNQNPQSLLSLVFNTKDRQLSGIEYTKNLVSRFSLVTEANAQGYGYTAINGLQRYWNGFRDMAYGLIVLVTIIFSFMIMFRIKLNPQTVISVQSAIPKIVTAIILATFSYAIAGFIIDLSYVIAGLFAALLEMAGFTSSASSAYGFIIPSASVLTGNLTIFWYMLLYGIAFFFTWLIALISTVVISATSILDGGYAVLVSTLSLLIAVWVFILMIWYTIKVPFVLIKNLVSIFMSIVVAPVQIVIGALVTSIGFGMWFKKLIAEVLVFPVTGLFMYLAMKTLGSSVQASLVGMGLNIGNGIFSSLIDGENLWSPAIIGEASKMAGLLWLGVSFGIMIMIPKAVDIMKMLIMGAKFDFGSAIGEAIGPAKAVGGLAVGSRMDKYDQWAKDLGTTPWGAASAMETGNPSTGKMSISERAKYVTWASLQKLLSGR